MENQNKRHLMASDNEAVHGFVEMLITNIAPAKLSCFIFRTRRVSEQSLFQPCGICDPKTTGSRHAVGVDR